MTQQATTDVEAAAWMAKEAEADRDIPAAMTALGRAAREAAGTLAQAKPKAKNQALKAAAGALRRESGNILAANAADLEAGRAQGLSSAMLDRLALDPGRIEGIAKGLEDVAALADPVGEVMAEWDRPNGLHISRVRVPLGAVGVIYEARPNVTADAGALCLKSGNVTILRPGSDSFYSSRAIHACLTEGLRAAGLPEAAIQIVPTRDRAAVGEMLTRPELIDIIVPRGGKSLVERVQNESKVPVLAHLEGICHVYLDVDADPGMAREITVNAKMRRPGVCGAAETLLVDRDAAVKLLPPVVADLVDAGCEVRGDEAARLIDNRLLPAGPQDWDTEYLDAIISVALVDGVDGAIAHISRHSSHHTESIVTQNAEHAAQFLKEVDSAIVMHNASTQFADGGEFGMGAEIGISTGRLHARGPVGVEQLTTFKYVVRGNGQTRP